MPRIVPLQLLNCLKVLLDENGGILSSGEVSRIASLMTKYSKKLVSKCIYVHILKVTRTELLAEFMLVGGWALVYSWLNDSIRAMNWPLVQEILELLLLCPVDVERLKMNAAPKTVKGLCRDGGNEGVRVLARRLVDQWLEIVTVNNNAAKLSVASKKAITSPNPIVSDSVAQCVAHNTIKLESKVSQDVMSSKNDIKSKIKQEKIKTDIVEEIEQDPLAVVDEIKADSINYTLTAAQKKANKTGLVYKIVVKDGQQILAKVGSTLPDDNEQDDIIEEDEEQDEANSPEEDSVETMEDETDTVSAQDEPIVSGLVDEDTSSSQHILKPESDNNKVNGGISPKADKSKDTADEKIANKENKKVGELTKDKSDKKDQKSSKDSKESKDRDKERKDKDRKSSSHHKSSSSSHKSSSSSSKSSSSYSKSKSSSSSSSSHRSSSDKHRSDKERSSSNKDKDRKEGSSSSSSSKHKSSSSSSSKSSSSSLSSSSSSKDRQRDKDKEKSNSSSLSLSSSVLKKDKDREKEIQSEKDKETLSKMLPPSLDKLGKIPKKSKEESDIIKPTSITIPSKKASMSIEIRRDSDKAKTVKTYKSQFRSHGLTEEAPPPPSRKGLKKPSSTTSLPGTVIPTNLPSSLRRSSPPRDSPTEKKAKIDLSANIVVNEKPGAIKLIPPKKMQTLVETNLFSDALSAATGPKKMAKRKRPLTAVSGQAKEGPSPPTSPEVISKVAPLKFYQDTLDESKSEDKSDKENEGSGNKSNDNSNKSDDNSDTAKDGNAIEEDDDDDIPLKKVKEDIEMKVSKEKQAADDGTNSNKDDEAGDDDGAKEAKKPGPGCGPNGPPGVLMLHRRKGPKKKLTWRPQEQLEQIRFFELDENERVNVTKTSSFMDMKTMERFSERDAINMSRRGFNIQDNMAPQMLWRNLIEVDDVPSHPNGNQSKQRQVQADRELTTLRALYFSHTMIPDSPAEAELEPHFQHDIPTIPLEDITGNPDAVNDFTSMPWPEPKGSPQYGDNSYGGTGGLGGLGDPSDMFGGAQSDGVGNPFNPFINPFSARTGDLANMPGQSQGSGGWQGPPPNNMGGPMNVPSGPIIGNAFNGHINNPNMNMNNGPMGPPPNFLGAFNQFGNNGGNGSQFVPGNGPQYNSNNFNGPNFGQMGPGNGPMGPMMNGPMMNGMGGGPRGNNRSNGGWRSGDSNFNDNSGGGHNNNWRSAGSGPNRGGNNNGVCKAFMRGHCRLGKSCKFLHPKSKRI